MNEGERNGANSPMRVKYSKWCQDREREKVAVHRSMIHLPQCHLESRILFPQERPQDKTSAIKNLFFHILHPKSGTKYADLASMSEFGHYSIKHKGWPFGHLVLSYILEAPPSGGTFTLQQVSLACLAKLLLRSSHVL